MNREEELKMLKQLKKANRVTIGDSFDFDMDVDKLQDMKKYLESIGDYEGESIVDFALLDREIDDKIKKLEEKDLRALGKKHPTQETLKELFYLKDGRLYNKTNRGKAKKDELAGSEIKDSKYRVIGINNERFYDYELIFIYTDAKIIGGTMDGGKWSLSHKKGFEFEKKSSCAGSLMLITFAIIILLSILNT